MFKGDFETLWVLLFFAIFKFFFFFEFVLLFDLLVVVGIFDEEFLGLVLLQILECVNSQALFDLQSQHDELEAKFFEERAALEAKYQLLYQPQYNKVSRPTYISFSPCFCHRACYSLLNAL